MKAPVDQGEQHDARQNAQCVHIHLTPRFLGVGGASRRRGRDQLVASGHSYIENVVSGSAGFTDVTARSDTGSDRSQCSADAVRPRPRGNLGDERTPARRLPWLLVTARGRHTRVGSNWLSPRQPSAWRHGAFETVLPLHRRRKTPNRSDGRRMSAKILRYPSWRRNGSLQNAQRVGLPVIRYLLLVIIRFPPPSKNETRCCDNSATQLLMLRFL